MTGVFPNQRRNTYNGPGFFDSDLSVAKSFKLTERMALSVGANFYNVFNHPNFDQPDANIADQTFGQVVTTAPLLRDRTERSSPICLRLVSFSSRARLCSKESLTCITREARQGLPFFCARRPAGRRFSTSSPPPSYVRFMLPLYVIP